MNISMEDVLFTDALGQKSKFDSFFVQNRLVRYDYDTVFFVIDSKRPLPVTLGTSRYRSISTFSNLWRRLVSLRAGGEAEVEVRLAEAG